MLLSLHVQYVFQEYYEFTYSHFCLFKLLHDQGKGVFHLNIKPFFSMTLDFLKLTIFVFFFMYLQIFVSQVFLYSVDIL